MLGVFHLWRGSALALPEVPGNLCWFFLPWMSAGGADDVVSSAACEAHRGDELLACVIKATSHEYRNCSKDEAALLPSALLKAAIFTLIMAAFLLHFVCVCARICVCVPCSPIHFYFPLNKV